MGRRYEPVIAMRLAADRLGGGRREGYGLTQGGGNEAQEGGTICNGLHRDQRIQCYQEWY